MEKLTEGQKLWWVPLRSRYSKEKEVTVLKVGRKWAQLDNRERIDIETLVVDAGQYSPNGCCYLSRDAYEQEYALGKAWEKLKSDLQYKQISNGVTISDIDAARKLLGLPSNDTK